MLHLRVIAWVSLACLLMPSSALAVTAPQGTPEPLTLQFSFPLPKIVRDGSASQIQLPVGAVLNIPGEPLLPIMTKTVELPFGTRVVTITTQTSSSQDISLPAPLALAPYPANIGQPGSSGPSSAFMGCYPQTQVTYQTNGGLNQEGNHVTFLTICVAPGQYDATSQILRWSCNWTVTASLLPAASSPFPTTAAWQLVIIAPDEFKSALQPLIDHKNALGITTTLKPLSEIYRDFSGRDKAEQIKLFIKSAIEQWDTKYILLVGGIDSRLYAIPRDSLSLGSTDWLLPVRYSNLWDNGPTYDPGFISDLYYADIYNGDGSFCSWDSNGDGVFGNWSGPGELGYTPLGGTDTVDFYPDVYVGRLPCRNLFECVTMVQKIISYESTAADRSWFKRAVVAGGDPYYDAGTNIYEGESIGDQILSLLPGFELVRLYASFKGLSSWSTPRTMNILRELRDGCGFLVLDGHGGPEWWNTCWPGKCNETIKFGGLSVTDLQSVHNLKRLPVCVIGGCHCCLLNITWMRSLLDWRNRRETWSNGHAAGQCLGEALVAKPDGGGIAVIGSTGIGYEASGENGDLDGDGHNLPDCCEALGGYLEISFFRAYENGTHSLGQAWSEALSYYLDRYPGMANRDDAKTVEQWILLGDPSLRIGGS